MKKTILTLALIAIPTMTTLANNVDSQPTLNFRTPTQNYQESLLKTINYTSHENVPSIMDQKGNIYCRKFTVQINIGPVSVSTEVIVCGEFNEYGGLINVWIKGKAVNFPDLADINDSIKEIMEKGNLKNITEIQVSSDTQTYENGVKLRIEGGMYNVIEQDGNYYFSPKIVTVNN